MRGPYRRLVDWTEEKAPPVHTFLTHDGAAWSWARTIVGFTLAIAVGVAILWGSTGQSLSEPPVVVIESGSMMDCEQGPGTRSSVCGKTTTGRLARIDPGDLVFVADVDNKGDVETFSEDGKSRHGHAGDVIVYARPGAPPIIHRAMFWVEIHNDGTYSVPELGLDHERTTDVPVLRDTERWRLRESHSNPCRLVLPLSDGPSASGFVTKGDNNDCWDQGSVLPGQNGPYQPGPVRVDEIIGKARGEIPWIGLLKLFIFDLLGGNMGTGDYAAAPGDLQRNMWITVGLVIAVPYGIEWYIKKRHGRQTHLEDFDKE